MTVLCNLAGGSVHAFQASLRIWAFERVIALDVASCDLRGAIVTLVCRSLIAIANIVFETIAGRALRGARFAERLTAADTMVAAGER